MAGRLKFSRGFSLKRLDLALKSSVNTDYLGNYRSAFKGIGLEFEGYRDYVPSSDDASRIDWKASKRVGQIVVKELKEERDIDVFFCVDASSAMLTGSTKSLKAEYVAEMISTLAQSVLSAGDSVGMTMFSRRKSQDVKKGMGMAQFYKITDELSEVSNYGGYNSADEILEHAYNTYDDGSLVLIFSDFTREITSQKFLKLASKKFDLIFVMIRDPIDMKLPEGEGEVFLEDPGSGTALLVRPKVIKKEFEREANLEVKKFEENVKKYGADFLLVQTDRPYLKEIIKFFKKREQKWR